MSTPEKTRAPRIRTTTVYILLVLILIVTSIIIGVLPYWLDREQPPSQGGEESLLLPCKCKTGISQELLLVSKWQGKEVVVAGMGTYVPTPTTMANPKDRN